MRFPDFEEECRKMERTREAMDEKLLADKIKHLYGDEFDVEQLKKAQEIAKKIMERDKLKSKGKSRG
jgi:hypothetical protein